MAEDAGVLRVGKIDNSRGEVTGDGFGGAAPKISRGEDKGAGFCENFLKRSVVGDADANGVEVIVIEMTKIRIFGEN